MLSAATEGGKLDRRIMSSATIALLLLIATASLHTCAEGYYVDPLDKHSIDLAGRLVNYGDVVSLRDLEALRGNLSMVAEATVLSFEEVYKLGRALSQVLEKLEYVSREVALSLRSFLGLTDGESSKAILDKVGSILVQNCTLSAVLQNSTNPIAILNELYSRGDIAATEYLLLLGYYVRELKLSHVDNEETLANVRRALSEVYTMLGEPIEATGGVIGGVSGRFGSVMVFKGVPALATSALALLLVAVSTPVVAAFLVELWVSKQSKVKTLRSLAFIDVGLITVSPPDDVVKAFWLAVDILSRVEPWRPWETPREYLAKVLQREGLGRVAKAFRRLVEEYEKVRYGGYSSSLSPRELVDLLSTVEKAVGSLR